MVVPVIPWYASKTLKNAPVARLNTPTRIEGRLFDSICFLAVFEHSLPYRFAFLRKARIILAKTRTIHQEKP